ncbi:MAG: stationary phase or STEss regulating sigma factor [Magnetococcales bacterium]|nr:stationary phase or STEss regulating sigma factor [Magnetococcales bacterium]
MEYFSDQQRGKREAFREDIPVRVKSGILEYICSLIDNGSFGQDFSKTCDEYPSAIIGTNSERFWAVCYAELPNLPEYLEAEKFEVLNLLDLIQFCFQHVCTPTQLRYHDYYCHHHLTFDKMAGGLTFLEKVNKIFERNDIVFRLQPDGEIIRTLPPELIQLLDASKTGNEAGFDGLLADAKAKICDPDPSVRKEALERLWDAWERLKTLEEGKDKKTQATKLLDKAALSPEFRNLLEKEAKELTEIGNTFQIRHHELGKHEIKDPGQIDYLFFRMLSMILLLLKARRGTPCSSPIPT